LHRRDAGQCSALRLVGLARRDNLAVGREETEAELAGRAFLDDELSGHGCLSFRGFWGCSRRIVARGEEDGGRPTRRRGQTGSCNTGCMETWSAGQLVVALV